MKSELKLGSVLFSGIRFSPLLHVDKVCVKVRLTSDVCLTWLVQKGRVHISTSRHDVVNLEQCGNVPKDVFDVHVISCSYFSCTFDWCCTSIHFSSYSNWRWIDWLCLQWLSTVCHRQTNWQPSKILSVKLKYFLDLSLKVEDSFWSEINNRFF